MCPFEPMKPEQDKIGILEVIQDNMIPLLLLTYRQYSKVECSTV